MALISLQPVLLIPLDIFEEFKDVLLDLASDGFSLEHTLEATSIVNAACLRDVPDNLQAYNLCTS